MYTLQHLHVEVRTCEVGSNWNGIRILVAGKPQFYVEYGKDFIVRSEGRTQARVAARNRANVRMLSKSPRLTWASRAVGVDGMINPVSPLTYFTGAVFVRPPSGSLIGKA